MPSHASGADPLGDPASEAGAGGDRGGWLRRGPRPAASGPTAVAAAVNVGTEVSQKAASEAERAPIFFFLEDFKEFNLLVHGGFVGHLLGFYGCQKLDTCDILINIINRIQ